MTSTTPPDIDIEALTAVARECPFENPGGYCAACQNGLHRCSCATRAYYRNAVRDPRTVLTLLSELRRLRAEHEAIRLARFREAPVPKKRKAKKKPSRRASSAAVHQKKRAHS